MTIQSGPSKRSHPYLYSLGIWRSLHYTGCITNKDNIKGTTSFLNKNLFALCHFLILPEVYSKFGIECLIQTCNRFVYIPMCKIFIFLKYGASFSKLLSIKQLAVKKSFSNKSISSGLGISTNLLFETFKTLMVRTRLKKLSGRLERLLFCRNSSWIGSLRCIIGKQCSWL